MVKDTRIGKEGNVVTLSDLWKVTTTPLYLITANQCTNFSVAPAGAHGARRS